MLLIDPGNEHWVTANKALLKLWNRLKFSNYTLKIDSVMNYSK